MSLRCLICRHTVAKGKYRKLPIGRYLVKFCEQTGLPLETMKLIRSAKHVCHDHFTEDSFTGKDKLRSWGPVAKPLSPELIDSIVKDVLRRSELSDIKAMARKRLKTIRPVPEPPCEPEVAVKSQVANKCPFCKIAFYGNGTVERHVKLAHPKLVDAGEGSSGNNNDVKPSYPIPRSVSPSRYLLANFAKRRPLGEKERPKCKRNREIGNSLIPGADADSCDDNVRQQVVITDETQVHSGWTMVIMTSPDGIQLPGTSTQDLTGEVDSSNEDIKHSISEANASYSVQSDDKSIEQEDPEETTSLDLNQQDLKSAALSNTPRISC